MSSQPIGAQIPAEEAGGARRDQPGASAEQSERGSVRASGLFPATAGEDPRAEAGRLQARRAA